MAAKKKAKRPAKRKILRATPKIKAAAIKSARKAAKGAPIRRAGHAKPAKKPRDTFTLHGLYFSLSSCKVGLMLTLCGVPWSYRHVDLMAGQHKTSEFMALNRFARVPVLEHDGFVIAESNVILDYLARVLRKFAGRNEAERLRVAEWLAWDLDRASAIGMVRAFHRSVKAPDDVMAFMRQRAEQALGVLESQFGQSKWLAGTSPTIADIAIFPAIAAAEEGGFDLSRWPNVQAWAQRFLALPGAAHPYAVMPREDR